MYSIKMKQFEEALEKNEAIAFLLGRGRYFVRDRDWGGHDSTHTYSLLGQYLKDNDKEESYDLIDKLIVKIFKSELLSPSDMLRVLGIIWSYNIKYEENILHTVWVYSDELKEMLCKQLKELRDNNVEMNDVEARLNLFKSRFNVCLDNHC